MFHQISVIIQNFSGVIAPFQKLTELPHFNSLRRRIENHDIKTVAQTSCKITCIFMGLCVRRSMPQNLCLFYLTIRNMGYIFSLQIV